MYVCTIYAPIDSMFLLRRYAFCLYVYININTVCIQSAWVKWQRQQRRRLDGARSFRAWLRFTGMDGGLWFSFGVAGWFWFYACFCGSGRSGCLCAHTHDDIYMLIYISHASKKGGLCTREITGTTALRFCRFCCCCAQHMLVEWDNCFPVLESGSSRTGVVLKCLNVGPFGFRARQRHLWALNGDTKKLRL